MGVFQKDGSNFYVRPLPYCLNAQEIINAGRWEFAFVDHTHTLVPSLNCASYIFAISFFQREFNII
jgi:hypothetical protein